MTRTGRRPGSSGTREAILHAARRAFAGEGYEAATIRLVARNAGVDPALVHHYFGTKEGLFAAALRLPFRPSEVVPAVLAGPRNRLGERILRQFLSLWDDPATRDGFVALVRTAATNERAAATLREFITHAILGRLVRSLDATDADLRASLVGSQLVGLAMARYILGIEPLAAADTDTLVRWLAPTLQRYLTGAVREARRDLLPPARARNRLRA